MTSHSWLRSPDTARTERHFEKTFSPPHRAANLRGLFVPTYIRIAEPKTVQPEPFALGIPLTIWALALLLIAGSALYDIPIASFDPQEQLAPF
jgi:hypothetical protein